MGGQGAGAGIGRRQDSLNVTTRPGERNAFERELLEWVD